MNVMRLANHVMAQMLQIVPAAMNTPMSIDYLVNVLFVKIINSEMMNKKNACHAIHPVNYVMDHHKLNAEVVI